MVLAQYLNTFLCFSAYFRIYFFVIFSAHFRIEIFRFNWIRLFGNFGIKIFRSTSFNTLCKNIIFKLLITVMILNLSYKHFVKKLSKMIHFGVICLNRMKRLTCTWHSLFCINKSKHLGMMALLGRFYSRTANQRRPSTFLLRRTQVMSASMSSPFTYANLVEKPSWDLYQN